MRVDENFIHHVVDNWDDEETQDMIQALTLDIKKEIRHTSNSQRQDFLNILIAQVQDETFWTTMDSIIGWQFDF